MNRAHRWLCRSSLWGTALEHSILPWVLADVDLGQELLEVGPGPGLTTDILKERTHHLTALEIDDRLATSLGRRLARSNVHVVEGDAAAMPFADESFSGALSLTMLHHVPTPTKQDLLFAEVFRVLQRGAWFAGTDSLTSVLFRLLHVGDTMVIVDPATLGDRLRYVGYTDAAVDILSTRFRFRARKPY